MDTWAMRCGLPELLLTACDPLDHFRAWRMLMPSLEGRQLGGMTKFTCQEAWSRDQPGLPVSGFNLYAECSSCLMAWLHVSVPQCCLLVQCADVWEPGAHAHNSSHGPVDMSIGGAPSDEGGPSGVSPVPTAARGGERHGGSAHADGCDPRNILPRAHVSCRSPVLLSFPCGRHQ